MSPLGAHCKTRRLFSRKGAQSNEAVGVFMSTILCAIEFYIRIEVFSVGGYVQVPVLSKLESSVESVNEDFYL